jgi:FtsH-binding integral membrane protein
MLPVNFRASVLKLILRRVALDYEIITPYNDKREKVLRNTYWLLALSLLPTVFGAYAGLHFDVLKMLGSVVSTLLFLVSSFGLFYLIEKNKDSYVGVSLLLVFTFFMGVMLSGSVGTVLGMTGGAYLVMVAFAGTAGVFIAMVGIVEDKPSYTLKT